MNLPPGVEALDAACRVLVAGLARESLYAVVACALALPAARLLRRAPARSQAALWALVLVRLALPPGLAAPWSARSVLAGVPAAREAARGPFGPLLGAAASQGTGADRSPEGAPAGPPWALLLAAGWLCGVAAAATTLRRRRRRYEDLLRRAEPVRDPEVLGRLEALARRLGVRRPVRLLAGDGAAPAFTIATVRPLVCVPAAFLDPAHHPALDAALAHELAHVRALDDLWLRLRSVVQALFFFHPVAWWAAARHADLRELAADERVLASGALSSREYGRGFTAAVRLRSRSLTPSGPAAAPALETSRRSLVMRLERILDPRTAVRRQGFATLLALAAAALVVLPMAAEPPADAAAPLAPALANPVPGARLTSAYGERWNPVQRSRGHHDGVDLGAPEGTPVLAPAAGVARVATERYELAAPLGTVVVVDHGDGLETLYAHLASLAVAPGQKVEAGETLGTVGTTGDVTGPHLHFEVHERGVAVDPAAFFELPVR